MFTADIIAYEEGTIPEDRIIQMFQDLVDSGAAWKLQGHYGRTAIQLIAGGQVKVDLDTMPPRARDLLRHVQNNRMDNLMRSR